MIVSLCYGATPQCKFLCDDPISEAVCSPVCAQPRCEYFCLPPYNGTAQCLKPNCRTRCPSAANSSPADSCPACEVLCLHQVPAPCDPYWANCQIQCEPLTCAWSCRRPPNPVWVKCQLVCEKPACEANSTFPVGPDDKKRSIADNHKMIPLSLLDGHKLGLVTTPLSIIATSQALRSRQGRK